MRNLIVIHLESLNNIIYRMNREKFPTLRKLEQKSLSFNKFFSTATSTLMVIGDLLYGGVEQYEQCNSLDYIPEEYVYKSSLFDELKEKGYKTNIYIYPDGGDRESAEKRHIAGFHNSMILIKDYNQYLEALNEAIDEEQPFALMTCNYISNLALNNYVPGAQCDSGSDKWEKGYFYMDKCVEDIWNILEKKKMLEDTTIIFYGDHGDDYWQHSFHGGLAHAIEPYAALVHTPFWIYDSRMINGEINDLVSTVDIKNIISYLLETEEKDINLQKINIFKRKYVLSRSAYAAQPVREDTFNKAYSYTDGKYFMLVSPKGLELYDIEMDPGCQNNFLDFFVLQDAKLIFNNEIQKKLGFHSLNFMNEKEKRIIRQKFYFLRSSLKQEVKKLYDIVGNEKNISQMNFEKINYIHMHI